MRPALLLVDLQNDFLRRPGLEPSAGEVVARAQDLLEGARRAGIPVVHVWTTVRPEDDRRMPHWRRQGRWLCVEGTDGHAAPAALQPRGSEEVVHKTFYSPFQGDALDEALRRHRVDTLIVAGLYVHGCVRAALVDAYARGLDLWAAEDAMASDDPLHAAVTRRWLEDRAARFATVQEILIRLGPEGGRAWPPPEPATEIEGATAAARDAFGAWAASPSEARAAVLRRLAPLVARATDRLAIQMAAELGKPVRYGRAEVARAAEVVEAAAMAALPSVHALGDATVRRLPLGVVAVVTPFNNPVGVPLGKIAPALALGNTVVWKPSPAGNSMATEVCRLLDEAGLPPGVVELVRGGRRAAERLMSDRNVDAVTVTGGSPAGYAAQTICAGRRIPIQAELGGNNAAIVWADATLPEAASRVAEGAFGYAGQRCTANRRVVVDVRCLGEFVAELHQATAALVVGDPLQEDVHVGPLVSPAAKERVAGVVERARRSASFVHVPHLEDDGAASLAGNVSLHLPTIVGCDDPSQEVVQEETFGPVLVVQPAASFDQALALCNGVRQGLVAALFSHSSDLQRRFLAEAQAGVLKLNKATSDVGVSAPFGGWKASGVGPPEHGQGNLEFYTRAQTVYMENAIPAVLDT